MEEEKSYKYTIDKQKLQEFCTGADIDESHLKAIDMLATVVLLKYFPSMSCYFKDLRQYMYLKACEIRHYKIYDSKQSAYNFLYTTLKNDVLNKLWKFSKEPNFEDILSSVISAEASKGNSDFSDVVVSSHEILSTENNFNTFQEISEYFPYLSGEQHFVKKRIPTKDILNLVLFLRLHEKKLLSHVSLPGFIHDDMDSDATRALYKLSSDLITLISDGDDDTEETE